MPYTKPTGGPPSPPLGDTVSKPPLPIQQDGCRAPSTSRWPRRGKMVSHRTGVPTARWARPPATTEAQRAVLGSLGIALGNSMPEFPFCQCSILRPGGGTRRMPSPEPGLQGTVSGDPQEPVSYRHQFILSQDQDHTDQRRASTKVNQGRHDDPREDGAPR